MTTQTTDRHRATAVVCCLAGAVVAAASLWVLSGSATDDSLFLPVLTGTVTVSALAAVLLWGTPPHGSWAHARAVLIGLTSGVALGAILLLLGFVGLHILLDVS